jgi:hypothetical protein
MHFVCYHVTYLLNRFDIIGCTVAYWTESLIYCQSKVVWWGGMLGWVLLQSIQSNMLYSVH